MLNEYIIEKFEEIASTNEYCKQVRGDGKNRIVIAKKQTGGKGTKGRSFSSNQGGVFLSKMDFYTDFPAKDAFLIMARSAVAVCKTLAFFGIEAKIKWANDIFVQGKKICGILIENVFSGQKIASSIVGVGLNVYNEFPKELENIAVSMREAADKDFSVAEVEKVLVSELCKPYTMQDYRSFLGFLGEEKIMLVGEGRKKVRLFCVDDDGALWVQEQGEKKKYYAAEVSFQG